MRPKAKPHPALFNTPEEDECSVKLAFGRSNGHYKEYRSAGSGQMKRADQRWNILVKPHTDKRNADALVVHGLLPLAGVTDVNRNACAEFKGLRPQVSCARHHGEIVKRPVEESRDRGR